MFCSKFGRKGTGREEKGKKRKGKKEKKTVEIFWFCAHSRMANVLQILKKLANVEWEYEDVYVHRLPDSTTIIVDICAIVCTSSIY